MYYSKIEYAVITERCEIILPKLRLGLKVSGIGL